MKRSSTSLFLLLAGILAAPASAETIAITNVTVIPVDSETSQPGRTVVIRDGEIVRIDTSNMVPDGARRIDGTGKFLMPGLADMHTHLLLYVPHKRPTLPLVTEAPPSLSEAAVCTARNELYLYLAYGVITVRDMSGTAATLDIANRVAQGTMDGPRIHVATPILDGNPPANPTGFSVTFDGPEQVPQAMKILAETRVGDARYEFVKIYERMQPGVYAAVVKEAKRYGLPIIGHVPFGVPVETVIADGQRSIEHLRGYEVDPGHVPTDSLSTERWETWKNVSDEQIDRQARLTAGKDTWNVPTLVINQDGMGEVANAELADPDGLARYVSPALNAILHGSLFPPDRAKDIFAAELSTLGQQRKMIGAMVKYGDKIMTGTDSPGLGVIPGTSMHREMELLVDYGLSPLQALRAATLEPQHFLGNDRAGYVGVGGRGDYLLLAADPLADIRNSRRISGVILKGRWWSQSSLESKLIETKACS